MTIRSAPVYQFPKADEIIERLVTELTFLREFPDHPDISEISAENRRGSVLAVERARRDTPEFLALAQLQVAKNYEQRDELREHPEGCPNCHGSGRWWSPGAHWEHWCNCPLGEASGRHRTLTQDAFDRGITRQEPVEDVGQLVMFAGGAA